MIKRNRAAIDMDVAVVNAQLEILQRREDELQKLIDDIQKLKDLVCTEKSTLEARNRSLEAERQSIHWLPTELLIHIFAAFADLGHPDLLAGGVHYHPPVIISHVCQQWRSISIATPHLWARFSHRGVRWDLRPLRTFLERSGTAPLDIFYRGSLLVSSHDERQGVSGMFGELRREFSRIRSLTLECRGPQAVMVLVEILRSAYELCLDELRICIPPSLNPPPVSTSFWTSLGPEPTGGQVNREMSRRLRHLSLEQVPLLSIPTFYVNNLRSLELSLLGRLSMSYLWAFLSHTPLLEEVVLTNTVPYFDIAFQPNHVSQAYIQLPCLATIDWSYPLPEDVNRFFSFLDAPLLERLELWTEQQPSKRSHDISSSLHPLHGHLEFPALRDLSLRADEDTIGRVLRRIVFPVLERLEIANVDVRAKGPRNTMLPALPRLESIFRDPRLPHLTHLTLSHFDISPEHGRAEAMLGYMPVLISLSLDACTGVGRLMDRLQEKAVGTREAPVSGSLRSRRGVKVCPRLEAISFWGCKDLDFGGLRAVVKARNRSIDGENNRACLDEGPDMASTTVTGKTQNGDEDSRVVEAMMGRKIKPLRKPRRQGQVGGDWNPGLSTPTATIASSADIRSTMVAMKEASRPAHIVYVRVKDCPSITQEEVVSLKDLGVVDVMWNSEVTW